ncbi:hypothetical protein MRB53_038577 [Persea americana]|nr:hypothetical protein MRB53_038577 [Persea americana]
MMKCRENISLALGRNPSDFALRRAAVSKVDWSVLEVKYFEKQHFTASHFFTAATISSIIGMMLSILTNRADGQIRPHSDPIAQRGARVLSDLNSTAIRFSIFRTPPTCWPELHSSI